LAGTGAPIADASGNSHDGIVVGNSLAARPTGGPFAGSGTIYFGTPSSYIDVAKAAGFETDHMSVEFWRDRAGPGGTHGNGCGYGTVAREKSGNQGWEVDTGNRYTDGCDGCVYFKYGNGSSQNSANTTYGTTITSGAWSYFAIVDNNGS